MSSREFITDAATRRAIFVQRYIGRQNKVVVKQIRQYKGQLSARLLEDTYISQNLTRLTGDIQQL